MEEEKIMELRNNFLREGLDFEDADHLAIFLVELKRSNKAEKLGIFELGKNAILEGLDI